MSLSCSLPLCFNLPLSPFPISKPFRYSLSRPFICFSLSSSLSNSNYEREEARWLREEQRWLREEQRWLRHEQRWLDERESLLRQVAALNLRIQELERRRSEMQGIPLNQIAESGSIAVPMPMPIVVVETAVAEESGGKVVEEEVVVVKEVVGEGKKRTTLRKGSEGDDVRAMQEALQKLGFYSGEEDMEFSSFSSGTERAVKTWQATLGAREDGIMTAELQERLYMEPLTGGSGLAVNADPKGNDVTAPKVGVNGAAFASTMEILEIQQTVDEEEGITEVDVSEHRVFLLGENRWEEPSRVTGRNKQGGGAKSTTKCLSCRGEGRILCMECDGTGEPNIEPQFMEWVDEGTKCPYCEGLGYTACDVCEGKALV
ncbi:protein disulfide isomerase pTAC5, chloroplastic-like [Actinidia eriantha]|uniref:protein disulfide isomerase pTAC5, chloroplastic-like n=1 Tax=Actinidia eriantha TaxID=165200 RepID=UPI0025877FE5|nr:protein disulfide isomerase pTAC5, chloroplastic-like [Actinidia eriantha]XP_057497265.1 protein disulfide isomerase pTAC5, chloroplastic-like [Actinidia eriantha]XP_057497266.1 protein disulfide isomerase pTAC5, chloroplastic-like [Actinidia eriantha]XP_057497267.1 protein disulfide isomerase pTAC5, chloroplastic-like [Actinidia eriantha]XP_057497268.1 protein disulfide isomerase pTAC5, chloroplastic-like [Actinidia eriantha]